jgi:hypothetical protein
MRPLMVFAYLGTIAGSLVLVPAAQAGKVIAAEIAQLVDVSERIVLAKVETVQDVPDPKNPDHRIRQAKATVKEVWKGPKIETVEYVVTPRSHYDSFRAVPGETVLLFLTDGDGSWRIAWAGQGRMQLETQGSKEYASYWRVIFPAGTPTVAFDDAVLGKKEGRGDKGVELKLVKELVDKAIAAGKK